MYLNAANHQEKISWQTLVNHKKIVIGKSILQPNAEIFLHKHKIIEYYFVLSGQATMLLSNQKILLKKNMFVKIPKLTYHHTKNNFSKAFVFLYFFNEGPFENIAYLS